MSETISTPAYFELVGLQSAQRELKPAHHAAGDRPVEPVDQTADAQKQHESGGHDAGRHDLRFAKPLGYGDRGDRFHRLHGDRLPKEPSADDVHDPRKDENQTKVHAARNRQGDREREECAEVTECAGEFANIKSHAAISVRIRSRACRFGTSDRSRLHDLPLYGAAPLGASGWYSCVTSSLSIPIAWGRMSRIAARDSVAPRSEPGRLMISVRAIVPASVRERYASGVFSRHRRRISSVRPG